MRGVMHEIVSPENTGFAPGRFIAENSILSKLTQAYLDEENLPGVFVFLDMEKAFDRVSWDYLHASLKALGFGQDFRSKIQTLYDLNNPQQRRVVVNGHASSYFNLQSGVAQGCPLSPLLYLCVAEGLTRAINANPKIKGIVVNGNEQKISQFADDAKLMLRDYKKSWKACKKTIRLYCKASGQKMNDSKTEALLLGSLKDSTENLPREWKICPRGKYIISLGVPIGNDFNEDEFWLNKYYKCKSLMARWKNIFIHSIKGRTLISQASVYSRFRYWMYSMMPSAKVDAYIKKDVRALLWAGHPEFDPQEGGTSTPSAPPFMKKEAAQLKWGDGGVGRASPDSADSLTARAQAQDKHGPCCNYIQQNLFITRIGLIDKIP